MCGHRTYELTGDKKRIFLCPLHESTGILGTNEADVRPRRVVTYVDLRQSTAPNGSRNISMGHDERRLEDDGEFFLDACL